MPQQTIDVGTFDNDPSADTAREAFTKCNNNFDELYAVPAGVESAVFTAVSTNYAVGITPGVFSGGFLAYSLSGDPAESPPFVLDFEPDTCRIIFWQQDANGANDGVVGFQIAATADFASVLFTGTLAIGTTAGLKTTSMSVSGLSGGPPYYVRWGTQYDSSLPTFNLLGVAFVFINGTAGGGSVASQWWLNQDDGLYYEVTMEGTPPNVNFTVNQTGQASPP